MADGAPSPTAQTPAPSPGSSPTSAAPPPRRVSLGGLAGRSLMGGLLMGFANVVPGISGGAMLLIVGIYHAFIGAIAQVTTLTFRLRPIVLLGCIGFGAVLSILVSAGPIKAAVLDYRWQVFSLFIGLRLGAVPLVWKLCKGRDPGPVGGRVWLGVGIGVVITAGLATLQYAGGSTGEPLVPGTLGFFLAGLVGASATILPGMDGSYFLLLMGQYVPILGAIDRFKDGLTAGNFGAMWAEVPNLVTVAVGVGLGLAGVSVLLRWLFAHYQKVTAGVLLGIVVGAVGGLWPFRQSVEPAIGSVVRGVEVTASSVASIPKEHWPVAFFTPTPMQVGASLGLVALGYVLAILLSKLDPGEEHLSTVQQVKQG